VTPRKGQRPRDDQSLREITTRDCEEGRANVGCELVDSRTAVIKSFTKIAVHRRDEGVDPPSWKVESGPA